MKYRSTKKYEHSNGFSTCFRQWRANSHCNMMHGYALSFEITFETDSLDARNWVVDFGSLKPIKEWLAKMFDHTTLVAKDDPELELFRILNVRKIIDLREVDSTGCEATARLIYDYVEHWLQSYRPDVSLFQVQVWEHPGNSASYGKY